MSSFIDLQGASGATYRFRAWPEAGQTPMAGNFVVIGGEARSIHVVAAGITNDLSRAPTATGVSADALFVRLNVSRRTRVSEHEDLIAQHRPDQVYDPG